MLGKLEIQVKVLIIVFVSATIVFSSLAAVYYLEGQTKAGIIKVQKADIENKTAVISDQGNKINNLEHTVENQTTVINFQTKNITSLNFTIFEQTDIIGRQITELRRRAESINLLEGNISKLKGDIQTKEKEIVSLTPFTRNYFVAAVKSDGGGAIIPLEVKILPKGTGLLSVNIKNVELKSGAQDSIRLAAAIASKLSGVSLTNKDIDVSFVNQFGDIVAVDGPSAGGAITVAIYAALSEKNINTNTLMTGTIETDGSIGQVGGVDKKAEAAKNQGAGRFLVPKGQKVSVSGLDVSEVNNIRDALNQIVG